MNTEETKEAIKTLITEVESLYAFVIQLREPSNKSMITEDYYYRLVDKIIADYVILRMEELKGRQNEHNNDKD